MKGNLLGLFGLSYNLLQHELFTLTTKYKYFSDWLV